jgi:hypothetical protein
MILVPYYYFSVFAVPLFAFQMTRLIIIIKINDPVSIKQILLTNATIVKDAIRFIGEIF